MSLYLRHLWLVDYRNYRSASVELPIGTTAIVGRNGQGKTNLLEAVAYLSGASLRGAGTEAMVAHGADRAVVRAEATRNERELLVEAEIAARGRSRMQINRQVVRRRRDVLETMAVTMFSPDDLELIKGSPGLRRTWIDDAIAGLDPRTDELRADVEKILRQRNALLKSVKMGGGRRSMDEAATLTLDVWDERLGAAGELLAARRRDGLDRLIDGIATAYRDLAGRDLPVGATYQAEWAGVGLSAALAAARDDDVRRGVTTVGPHRDDVVLTLDGLPARTHASQGEQRSFALALRLAVHRAIAAETGISPILLLDDVLSELDPGRAEGLLAHLPVGQTLLTTASELPAGRDPDLVIEVSNGSLTVTD